MATATATTNATSALADMLMDNALPVADVLAKVGERNLAIAWARGDIEFGRIKHCVTGRPGVPESNPTLLIETDLEWTGPKTQRHKGASALIAETVPDCRKYRKYVSFQDGDETKWKTVEIVASEAAKLMTLHVRLTDKGLGESI